MYSELYKPFQQHISDRFLKVLNQLRKNEEPKRTFELSNEPTRDELKFLTDNYGNEISLSRIDRKKWILLEGTYDKVDVKQEIEDISDISAHYHAKRDGLPNLPSLADIFYINKRGKNFILNHEGITYFSEVKKHPLTGLPWKPSPYLGEVQLIELFNLLAHEERKKPEYDAYKFAEIFLGKMGVEIIIKPWKKLPSGNPLSGF
jgi:hypothetical protein